MRPCGAVHSRAAGRARCAGQAALRAQLSVCACGALCGDPSRVHWRVRAACVRVTVIRVCGHLGKDPCSFGVGAPARARRRRGGARRGGAARARARRDPARRGRPRAVSNIYATKVIHFFTRLPAARYDNQSTRTPPSRRHTHARHYTNKGFVSLPTHNSLATDGCCVCAVARARVGRAAAGIAMRAWRPGTHARSPHTRACPLTPHVTSPDALTRPFLGPRTCAHATKRSA
jgi:hypothetical protein